MPVPFRSPCLRRTAPLAAALATLACTATAPALASAAAGTPAPAAAPASKPAPKPAPAAKPSPPAAVAPTGNAPPASATAPAATAPAPAPAPATLPQEVEQLKRDAQAEGLLIQDLKVGRGTVALPGMMARVHYTGWLQDPAAREGKGRVFDSSRDRGQPFAFPLGAGRVIRGWDLGVAGMQPGGQRRLVIPASLAYGERGAGGVIPPNATLVFDVELLSLAPAP